MASTKRKAEAKAAEEEDYSYFDKKAVADEDDDDDDDYDDIELEAKKRKMELEAAFENVDDDDDDVDVYDDEDDTDVDEDENTDDIEPQAKKRKMEGDDIEPEAKKRKMEGEAEGESRDCYCAEGSGREYCRCLKESEKLPPFYPKDGLSPEQCYDDYLDAVFDENFDSYMSEDMLDQKEQQWARYYQQVEESQGFDIEDFPNGCLHIKITKSLEDPEDHVLFSLLATTALDKFNAKHSLKGEAEYKFFKIVKLNAVLSTGYSYYMTFNATTKDTRRAVDAADLATFQAHVWDDLPRKIKLHVVRIKPSPSP